ncbi:hypothetical protein SSTU70S_01030 [Stutzerimonas stutzeri]
MASSTASIRQSSASWNRRRGSRVSQVAFTAAQNSASLSLKWLYSVSLETPASLAMASMLLPS